MFSCTKGTSKESIKMRKKVGMSNLSDEVFEAVRHTREAKKTKPMCPVHAARAMQHYENAKAEIDRRIHDLNEGMKQ
jgi:hypothetical protein